MWSPVDQSTSPRQKVRLIYWTLKERNAVHRKSFAEQLWKMSSNESEDFEDTETEVPELTQVYQSDQEEMHFYQEEKTKEVKH